MFPYDRQSIKDCVKLQCRKEVTRQVKELDHRINHTYLTVVERLVENDARTRTIFERHAAALEDRLERKAGHLLQDSVVRADLLAAARQDNERRMTQLESSYTWDVRVAKWMSGAALLGLTGLVGARLFVVYNDANK